ncbi:MAG: glycosyltransferase [Deltaproteobacteria bacterium]|nr:glycosyltransferase [Deltaproteobacteria bacterium]
MQFSIITPNYNGEKFLEKTISSVVSQRQAGIDLEYIVIDGESTDNSLKIIEKYADEIDCILVEKDTGPANAINKGLSRATGELIAWLNSDDFFFPGALSRIKDSAAQNPDASFFFGPCIIVDRNGREIRKGITRFKEFFFPISSRFTLQCINYVSQPATFFRQRAYERAGLLDENLVAAWDYDFLLRLMKQGRAVRVKGRPLAAFRWHEESIGGKKFSVQFKEELEIAKKDAGPFAPQTFIHHGVRWGIVGIYSLMALFRNQGPHTPSP